MLRDWWKKEYKRIFLKKQKVNLSYVLSLIFNIIQFFKFYHSLKHTFFLNIAERYFYLNSCIYYTFWILRYLHVQIEVIGTYDDEVVYVLAFHNFVVFAFLTRNVNPVQSIISSMCFYWWVNKFSSSAFCCVCFLNIYYSSIAHSDYKKLSLLSDPYAL